MRFRVGPFGLALVECLCRTDRDKGAIAEIERNSSFVQLGLLSAHGLEPPGGPAE